MRGRRIMAGFSRIGIVLALILSLPLFAGEGGLPLAAQLIGPFGRDGRLLRTATALIEAMAATQKSPRRSRALPFGRAADLGLETGGRND